MTTSFAHLVRGQFPDAFRANSGGLLAGLVCAVLIPWCWLSAFYARLCWIHRPGVATIAVLGTISVVALVQWLFRVLLWPPTLGF
jgi:hypothetical protein